MSWLRRQRERLRVIWRMALEENATPERFALAVALGVFIAGSAIPPVFGLRTLSAGIGAWIGRLNKLTACLSVHLLAPVLWAVIYLEVWIGSRLLGRPAPSLSYNPIAMAREASHAMLAWIVGSMFVAPALAALAGAIAYPIAKRYHSRRALLRRERPSWPNGD